MKNLYFKMFINRNNCEIFLVRKLKKPKEMLYFDTYKIMSKINFRAN